MRRLAILSIVLLADSEAQTVWSNPGPPVPPPARAGPVMAFDEVSGSILMFGGDGGGPFAPLQETWLWSGGQWQLAQLASQPEGVVNAAMAADPRRRRLVLFGGFSRNAETSQTWEWDGSAWIGRVPAQNPAPRWYHAMAFDEVRGAMLLFGGLGGSFALSDTWSWDGTVWSQLSPTRAPSARAGHVMVCDPVRRRVVLFGGYVGTGRFYTPYNDTWEWDGTNWTERVMGLAPNPREGACGMFDARRGRMVLFGGYSQLSTVWYSDTWEWNGAVWLPRTSGVPSARYLAGLAYDAQRGRGVLFGGYGSGSTPYLNDTWEYGPTFPAEVQPYGQACAGSAGTPAHTALNLPWLGDTYSLRTAPLPAPAFGFLFLGFDRTWWNGVPLPLDLSPLGMLGCRLELEIPLLFAAGDPGSSLTWSLPIGTTPDLLGFTFFSQSLHLDLFANPFGATTSNGLRHRIGGR